MALRAGYQNRRLRVGRPYDRPVVASGPVQDSIAEVGDVKRALDMPFLPPGPSQMKARFHDVDASLEGRHEIKAFNKKRDLGGQFARIGAVIDFGGNLGTRDMADVAPDMVRLWQVLGTGFDHFDLPYWKSRGIPVANCPGYLNTPPLGDCAHMFLLMLARRWHESRALLQKGVFV